MKSTHPTSWFVAAAIAAVAALTARPAARADRLRNVQPGEPVPAFACPGLDRERVALDEADGRASVLVYLSARQPQSERALEAAHKTATALGKDQLAVFYMTADVDQQAYFRELRDRFSAYEPFALDAGQQIGGRLGLIVQPTIIVAGPDGKLIHIMASWGPDDGRRLELYCRHAQGEFGAGELIERLAALAAPGDEERGRAQRHRTTAGLLAARGLSDAAAEELRRALELVADDVPSALDLAEIHLAQGRLEEAERGVTAVLARHEDVPQAQLLMATIDLERGRLAEAENRLLPLQPLHPDTVRLNYVLGQLYEQKNDYAAAARHYRLAAAACLDAS